MRRSAEFADHQPPAGTRYPSHLGQSRFGIDDIAQPERDRDAIESVVFKRQGECVAGHEGKFGLTLAAGLQHSEREVAGNCVRAGLREGRGRSAGAGGEIEDAFAGAGFHRPHRGGPPEASLTHCQDVVGEVVLSRDLIEHLCHLLWLLTQVRTRHKKPRYSTAWALEYRRNLEPIGERNGGRMTTPRLFVDSYPIDEIEDLLALLPSHDALSWVRQGEGLIGWGEAARYEVDGAERFSRASRWWARTCSDAVVNDSVLCAGSGPVVFASFAFDANPGNSVLVVPRVVVGKRNGKSWATVISTDEPPTQVLPHPTEAPPTPGHVSSDVAGRQIGQWKASVTEAINRINAGELDKVVLARDVVVTSERALDPRHMLNRLAAAFPGCWAFCVDGLIGATPELLIQRNGDQVTSRVLAGTVRAGDDRVEDGRLAQELLGSDKDQEEHSYAVTSVAAALSAHCTDLVVPIRPSVLSLANVQHLATNVSGLLVDDTPVLALAASLHPTAAVCGTPTERAFALIRRIEQLDRGRYAGPVGWMDANGDGEFGIALRCGMIERAVPNRIRLFAGCGIVAGSDPAAEVAESEAKLLAMRHALSSD